MTPSMGGCYTAHEANAIKQLEKTVNRFETNQYLASRPTWQYRMNYRHQSANARLEAVSRGFKPLRTVPARFVF